MLMGILVFASRFFPQTKHTKSLENILRIKPDIDELTSKKQA